MAVRQSKKISELTELISASLNTLVVGVESGITYKIKLETLVSTVQDAIALMDGNRFNSLEAQTGSYFIDSASFDERIIAATNEQDLSYLLATSSFNEYTQSQNQLNTTWATTGSNQFNGSQTISGSVNVYSPIPPSLSIGDSFQGGKVAYILQSEDGGYDPNLVQGIIAAESDEPTTLSWVDAYTSCDNKTTNGYDDWYLPNWNTLYYTLYVNKDAIGGFTSNVYWSQTQVDFMNYQGYGFGDNSSYSSPNTYEYYVRAVRNFSIPKTAFNVTGNTTFSGSVLVSGSLIPATGEGTLTSSFSLGDSTHAWKDIWVSNGTIHFVGEEGAIRDTLSATADGLEMTNILVNGSATSNLILNPQTLSTSITIPEYYNGLLMSPVATNDDITIKTGGILTII